MSIVSQLLINFQVLLFYLALSQIICYVDGMEGVMSHCDTIRWLYSLIASKVPSFYYIFRFGNTFSPFSIDLL